MIASEYVKKNNIDSVRKYIFLADQIKRDELPIPYQTRIKSILALISGHDGNNLKAQQLINESYKITDAAKESTEKMYSQFVLGKVYTHAGKPIQKSY